MFSRFRKKPAQPLARPTWTADDLLPLFLDYAAWYEEGAIRAEQYAARMVLGLAELDQARPDLIPALWQTVPATARAVFLEEFRKCLLPGFWFRPMDRLGGPVLSPQQLQREGDRHTACVRAWASEFIRQYELGQLIGGGQRQAEPGAAPDRRGM